MKYYQLLPVYSTIRFINIDNLLKIYKINNTVNDISGIILYYYNYRWDMSETKNLNFLNNQPAIANILDTIHDIALILNENREIVYFNDKFRAFADQYNLSAEVGLTPGAAFHCVHAMEDIRGCGKTDFCKYCGGNNSILQSLQNQKSLKECRIAAMNGNSFDLKISASPIYIDGQNLILYCIQDASAETRKQMLERIFFHDISNIVNGMNLILDSITYEIEQNNQTDCHKDIDLLTTVMNSLKDEISSQHIISLAEKDELIVSTKETCLNSVIKDLYHFFKSSSNVFEIELNAKLDNQDKCLKTDPTLLKRILVNMIKNACEASKKGETVTIWHEEKDGVSVICVHNEAVMSDEVKKSVFKRSFSTKGTGRGIGTYSMRLLAERYLKGKISFTSEKGKGTTFSLTLPISLQD